MTITGKAKQEELERLTKCRIRRVNIGVLRGVFWHIHKDQGVAFAANGLYASRAGRSERTVQRTIQFACEMLVLRRAHREWAPDVLWCPALMDMEPEEAIRRADGLARDYKQKYGKVVIPHSGMPPHPLPECPASAGLVPASGVPASAGIVAAYGLHPEVIDALVKEGASPEIIAAAQSAASELAPDSAPKVTPKLAPELAPLNPIRESQKINPKLSPSPPPKAGGVAWRPARAILEPASSAAHDLTVEIGKHCGLRIPTYGWPEHWRREAPHIVQSWLTDYGWNPDYILCVVRDAMAHKSDGPPGSVRFFEKPIARLYARLERQRVELEAKRAVE